MVAYSARMSVVQKVLRLAGDLVASTVARLAALKAVSTVVMKAFSKAGWSGFQKAVLKEPSRAEWTANRKAAHWVDSKVVH